MKANKPNADSLMSSDIKTQMLNKNQFNLPTYFQFGRNSVAASESLYTADPKNKGLIIIPPGKKQNIPVEANVLSKSDSAERLNLRTNVDSPQKRYAAQLRLEERKFKE